MEMDIDIEEHDVLAHPRIQEIFPDLSLVKNEPIDMHDEEELEDFDTPDPDSFPHLQISSVSSGITDPNEDYYKNKNKIILGSKPNSATAISRARAFRNSNGLSLRLNLQDMGGILKKSGRYCNVCQTLFKTHYAFDTHKQAVHSLLALVRNVAVKSTSKGTARKSTTSVFESQNELKLRENKDHVQEGKLCDHCNVLFPDGEALVKHLYDLLIKKFKCDSCSASFNNAPDLKAHSRIHVKAKPVKFETVKVEPVKLDAVKIEPKSEESDVEDSVFGKLYQCTYCTCFFSRIKNFDKHMALFSITDYEYKKVKFDGQCKQCKCCSITPTLYNKHFYKTHGSKDYHGYIKNQSKIKTAKQIELLTKPIKIRQYPGKVQPNPVKIPQSPLKVQYLDQNPGIIVKTEPGTSKRPVAKKSVLRYKLSNYRIINNPPIPLSTVFKCSKCQSHFLTCFKATCHFLRCTNVENNLHQQCAICKRTFFKMDMELHRMQHALNSKFKVYLTHNKMTLRVLCRCPECEIHFDEYSFWTHVAVGCDHGAKYELCKICNLYFHAMSYSSHIKRHKEKKLVREDFIVIDFVINPDDALPTEEETEETRIPKLEITRKYRKIIKKPTNPETAIPKTVPGKEPLFYCKKCKSYISYFTSAKIMHLRYNCLSARKQLCLHCGLSFAPATYMKHQKKDVPRNLTLHDFVFYTLDDGKKIRPPMPILSKCTVCATQVLKIKTHDCQDTVKCDVCNGRFSQDAYRIHRPYHDYGRKVNSHTVEKKIALPELLKKYEALQKIWNILYLCGVCDIATDSYDKAINHCHIHYYNKEKVSILRKCNNCNLKFEGGCFEKHKQYHTKTINRDAFDIFKYNYKDISQKNWLFGPLPQEQVRQIELKSIYRYTRFVIMKLIGSGSTDLTVYKCMTCLKYVAATEVAQHTRQENCSPNSKGYPCNSCRLPFNSPAARDEHQAIHSAQIVDLNSFRIVGFNDEKDRELNRLLEGIDLSRKDKTPVKRSLEEIQDRDDVVYQFYRCKKCELCYRNVAQRVTHKCDSEGGQYCDDCNLKIPEATFRQHAKQHNAYPVFNLANFCITEFEPNQSEEGTKIKLYHCKVCDINYLTTQGLKYHIISNHEVDSISTCDDCGYRFSESVYQLHLLRHHEESTTTREDFQVVEKDIDNLQKVQEKDSIGTVYKCKDCDVCYITHTSLVKSHRNGRHNSPRNRKACDICGIIFSVNSMTRHAKYHHKYLKLTKSQMRIKLYKKFQSDFREVNVIEASEFADESCVDLTAIQKTVDSLDEPPNETADDDSINESIEASTSSAKSKKDDEKIVLYKCASNCDVHFLVKKTLQRHYLSDHAYQSIPCPECKLKFTVISVKRHILLHHRMQKCSKKDFQVEVLDYSRGRKEFVSSSLLEDGLEAVESQDEEVDVEEVHDSVKKSTRKRFRSSLLDIDLDMSNDKAKASKTTTAFRNFLFRCIKCDLYFNIFKSLCNHFKSNHAQSMESVNCNLCGLKFTKMSLNNHIENQHGKTGNLKDIVIFSITDLDRDKDLTIPEVNENKPPTAVEVTFGVSDKTIYSCRKCNLAFMSMDSILNHCYVANHKFTFQDKCEKCGLIFTRKNVLANHIYLHHRTLELGSEDYQFVTDTMIDLDLSEKEKEVEHGSLRDDVTSEDDSQISVNSNKQIKLYKCAECDVCFITQSTCYKHVIKHVKLHPKEYIQCKFCNLQFRYITLQKHIKIHHDDDSKIDNLLIEEYFPMPEGGPKINIYYANNKGKPVSPNAPDSTVTSTTFDNTDAMEEDESNKSNKDEPSTSNINKENDNVDSIENDNVDSIEMDNVDSIEMDNVDSIEMDKDVEAESMDTESEEISKNDEVDAKITDTEVGKTDSVANEVDELVG